MKQQMKLMGILVLVLTVALAALPATAHAAGEPQLQLSAEKAKVKVGAEVTVDVLVKNALPIYGADVRLLFDPDLVEVVDADKDAAGIQIKPGKFLDPDKGFFLQYWVDNEAGTIDYALTLLNPAPPAKGNGMLMQVTFRGKADGLATIAISDGLFGTQAGDTVQPGLDQINLVVGHVPTPIPTSTPTPTSTPIATPVTTLALAGGLAAVGMAGVGGGGWFWLRHARRR